MSLSDIMAAAGLSSWAEVGLIISFVTFAAIVLWILLRRKDTWDDVRKLPLDDDARAGDERGGSPR